MKRTIAWISLGALATSFSAAAATAQAVDPADEFQPTVEARVWLDRGDDPVLDRGDRVRVYYRTSQDGYLSIFHIDTNGNVRLLFPSSPDADHFVRGGRDYRLLFPRASYWFVDEDPGQGYFFALASPEPFDFREFTYSRAIGGWDLSHVGGTAYEDPFLAMDEYIASLVPDWEYADYSLDYVQYDVGARHDYPRFLCYDCHGFSSYSVWNPYLSACTSFRVVIYNDPWYYAANRYVGTRVVYVRPAVWRQPRYVFKERAVGEPWTPIVRTRPTVQDRPGIPGNPAQRRSGSGIGSGGTVPPVSRPATRRPSMSGLQPRGRPTATLDARRRGGGAVGSADPRSGAAPRSATPTTRRYEPNTRRPSSTPITPSTRRTSPSATRESPRSERSSRPILERRPTTRPGSGSAVRSSPTRSSSGSAVRSSPTRSSSGSTVRSSPTRSSSGSAVRRAPSRSSGSTVRSAPTRSSSGSSVRRAPARSSSSSGTTRRSPPRSSGSAARTPTRAPTRSSARPARAPTRSSGSAARRPVVRRKPGGGGP